MGESTRASDCPTRHVVRYVIRRSSDIGRGAPGTLAPGAVYLVTTRATPYPCATGRDPI
jgi:hypothetical protein